MLSSYKWGAGNGSLPSSANNDLKSGRGCCRICGRMILSLFAVHLQFYISHLSLNILPVPLAAHTAHILLVTPTPSLASYSRIPGLCRSIGRRELSLSMKPDKLAVTLVALRSRSECCLLDLTATIVESSAKQKLSLTNV